ncbi:phage holin family protein [Aliiroseovarius sp. PTFE2010]|uniref:phage holin family protein n=1 Tax=Aliiroseovarius sp. PTFE2010 TaxID=3417190 RepID=UPI003CE6A165
MRRSEQPSSTLALLVDVFRHSSRLVEKEIELARSELRASVSRAGVALALLVFAAVLAMVALNLLAGFFVGLLVQNGIAPTLATVLVAVGFGLVALVLGLRGLNDLKSATPVPEQTMANLRQDAAILREKTNV